jgi:glycosyltransferase involved in cell wall biosynthesis
MKGSPRHLAILLPTLCGGGAERSMLKLAGGFLYHGFIVDLVLVHKTGPLISEVPKHMKIVDLNAPRAFSSRALSSLPALVAYLRQERPDILYTGLMTSLIALWARRIAHVPTRVVISERNVLSLEVKQFPRDIRFRLMPLFVKIFYPWADGIVAVSQAVAVDLAQLTGIPLYKINVIYNPVVTDELRAKAQIKINHPWFDPGQPPVILAVGRLFPQKDYPTLLRAFASLCRSRPVHLIILGEGDERKNLELLAGELGIQDRVCFPGFIENPYPYMKNAALFVLSSRFEGLPGVLIEALFCGTPVIASDCPGGSREILGNGKYGQLVPLADPESLARALASALKDKPIRPPEESWKPFELENIIRQYIDLFDALFAPASNT